MTLLNSFCTDMLIPALPAMSRDLGISGWQVQQSLSLFFVACAFASLWYGAIADAWGRRRTLLVALSLLGLAAAASIFVTRIEQLWGLRLLQGLAAGAGLVISRSILHDLHHGPDAQHLLSWITLIQTSSLLVTPSLGAWLCAHYGWRMVFAALTAIVLTLTAVYWRWLPETLPRDRRLSLSPAALGRAYLKVLQTPRFVRLSLAHVANWTSMAVYIVSAPAIVVGLLGRSGTDIYLVYVPITLGLVAGFMLFPRLLRRWQASRTLATAYFILGTSAGLNLAAAWAWPAGMIHLAPLFTYSFGLAIALPILVSGALEPLRQSTGVAASCQTFMQYAMTAVAAGLLAPLLWDSLFSLALGIGGLTLVGGLAVLLERQANRRPPPEPMHCSEAA
ncbi:Inner membrane transport protein YdhC [compost metagenome]